MIVGAHFLKIKILIDPFTFISINPLHFLNQALTFYFRSHFSVDPSKDQPQPFFIKISKNQNQNHLHS